MILYTECPSSHRADKLETLSFHIALTFSRKLILNIVHLNWIYFIIYVPNCPKSIQIKIQIYRAWYSWGPTWKKRFSFLFRFIFASGVNVPPRNCENTGASCVKPKFKRQSPCICTGNSTCESHFHVNEDNLSRSLIVQRRRIRTKKIQSSRRSQRLIPGVLLIAIYQSASDIDPREAQEAVE